ncbi:unnamed protein product [Porites evermanni]|uniref:PSI domain-containing protein n=1 Tax=Porites evermanni TaxID=104178 RepID=A0ABN8PIJ8_9CNID|nr:unnamed protein product [Porites evermanni]
MLRLQKSWTAFLLLILCFIQIYLLEVSVGTSETKEDKCNKFSNKSCDECVKQDGCAFCEKDKHCIPFDVVKDVTHKSCEGQDWKYKQCVVSGKVLLIALPVTGFVVLLALGCTIYCCCCRKKKRFRGLDKEETKWRRQREEIEIKHKERREERQKKHDEIRKKYGLYKKDDSEETEDGRYHRFDNTAVA